MRVVLDECLPKRLARELPGHEVTTVPAAGLAGLVNGKLLRRISGNYEVFVTIDGNLTAQQNMKGLSFAVIVLRARSNKIEDIRPLIPQILEALSVATPGQVAVVE
jgi:predicted nuclease of predicted toxin-antitoxin system